jgi:hypothetical protein
MNRQASKAPGPIELSPLLISSLTDQPKAPAYTKAGAFGWAVNRKTTCCDSINTRVSEIPHALFAAGVTGDHGTGRIRG